MREVVYDTETTGKRTQDGHRVVELGAIELIDGVATGRVFHRYFNPERDIPDEVVAIHGITNERVANEPTFREVLPEFLEFFEGAIAIAHNSEFDEKFLDNEMKLAGHPQSFWSLVSDTVDTIYISRKLWKGKDPEGKEYRHGLDAVLDRCEVDRSRRVHHGALLDSELLESAYAVMKKKIIELGPTLEDDVPRAPVARLSLKHPLVEVVVPDADALAHNAFVSDIAPKSTPLPALK